MSARTGKIIKRVDERAIGNIGTTGRTPPNNRTLAAQPKQPANSKAPPLKASAESCMKTLLLLRHAKSSWNNKSLCDHDRPLNQRGQKDAPRVGVWLSEAGLVPDLVLSSTAVRAQTTARLMVESAGYAGEIQLKRDLYHADCDDFLEALHGLDGTVTSVLVVGHNPGLEEFLELLTGQHDAMPTAALAHIELSIEDWRNLTRKTQGRLVQLWRPKERS
jgi:phosphohistidine phosphatase